MNLTSTSDTDAPSTVGSDHRVRTWRTLLQVHTALVGELERAFAARHHLSLSEFDVMINIAPHARVRHCDLADRVVLTRTAVTRVVDRLVARGLLERASTSEDLRAVLVGLTEQGRLLRRAAARTNSMLVRAAFADLSAEQTRQLGDALAVLHATLITTREGRTP